MITFILTIFKIDYFYSLLLTYYNFLTMNHSHLKSRFLQLLALQNHILFKEHQFEGIDWCFLNETRNEPPSNCRGGLIFDEVGLGKTLIIIALMFLNPLKHSPTLIVLPPNLIKQWASAIFSVWGYHPVLYHGSKKDTVTLDILQHPGTFVVLTSYHLIGVKRDEESTNILHQVQWGRVVCDEAHHLKNKNSFYYGIHQLKTNITWLLTGTPVQNKASDLYNLCDLVGIPRHIYRDDKNTLFTHFILHRTKVQIGMILPDLIHQEQVVSWSNAAELQLSATIHASAYKSDGNRLGAIIQARQICILPELVRHSYKRKSDSSDPIESHESLQVALLSSSKMDAFLKQIISRSTNSNKKIVFCHFRAEIDFIIHALVAAGINHVHSIDGRSSLHQRHKLFKHGYDILVLQLQTAAEGLNLQDYNEIYFIAPHWNPAVETQAIGRCHRQGQSLPVHVFRFYMEQPFHSSSADHLIRDKQLAKSYIANSLLQP